MCIHGSGRVSFRGTYRRLKAEIYENHKKNQNSRFRDKIRGKQYSSRTRHLALAVAALDKSLGMV